MTNTLDPTPLRGLDPDPALAAAPRFTVEPILAILLGIAVFYALRAFAVERYVVPSRSMEPLLHGDEVTGDRVLVDKRLRTRTGPIRRLDLVVVRDGPRNLIKRVVSAPDVGDAGEYLAFRQGDVFVGGSRRSLRRVVKDPDAPAARSLECTAWRWSRTTGDSVWDPAVAGPVPERLPSVPEPSLLDPRTGAWSTSADLDASFLDTDARRLANGRGTPRDVGVEVVLTTPLAEGVRLGLQVTVFGRRNAVWIGADGSCVHVAEDPATEDPGPEDPAAEDPATEDPATVRPLEAPGLDSRARRFRLACLDGRLYLRIGDAAAVVLDHEPLPIGAPAVRVSGPRPRANRLCLAVVTPSGSPSAGREAGGGPLVESVTLFHDVHYRPESDRVFRVEGGELFLVGDHSYDSADSRSRSQRPFRRRHLVGMPFAIVGPWSRMRWLERTGLPRGD